MIAIILELVLYLCWLHLISSWIVSLNFFHSTHWKIHLRKFLKEFNSTPPLLNLAKTYFTSKIYLSASFIFQLLCTTLSGNGRGIKNCSSLEQIRLLRGLALFYIGPFELYQTFCSYISFIFLLRMFSFKCSYTLTRSQSECTDIFIGL